MPVLEVKHLTKSFADGSGRLVALNDVSFSIEKGEIYGVIGASGAGKSTLIRCLNLLERPDKGEVCFEGINLRDLTKGKLREVRKRIGMIFQGFNLLNQKTVAENIAFPLLLKHVRKSERQARVSDLLKLVGLEDKADRFPSELSGGQKQRVAIARALSNYPSVLLCDEPTSALDPATTGEILSLIRSINEQTGISVVIITHQMEVIEAIGDRVAIIDQGQIVEEGQVKDIFYSPKSEAAQKIILKHQTDILPCNEPFWRLVFHGDILQEPLIATLTREVGVHPNIFSADIKTLHDGAYGEMILTFDTKDDQKKIADFLNERKIHFVKEETYGSKNH